MVHRGCAGKENTRNVLLYSRKLKVYIFPLDARLRDVNAPGGKNP
jgi:hypothetical protein